MLKKNCYWDYPTWEFEQEFVNSDRIPVVPKECMWCEYVDACKVRVALLINLWIEINDERLEELKILAGEEKSQPQILQ